MFIKQTINLIYDMLVHSGPGVTVRLTRIKKQNMRNRKMYIPHTFKHGTGLCLDRMIMPFWTKSDSTVYTDIEAKGGKKILFKNLGFKNLHDYTINLAFQISAAVII